MLNIAGTTGGHPLYLKCGASEEVLRDYPDNKFDSIVCDPPYFIGFQGDKNYWDRPENDLTQVWEECLRVLKPGGYLLAFGYPRTYHRLAVQIENAGFEIKDQIMWVYVSGFPKGRDVGLEYDQYMDNFFERHIELAQLNGEEIESMWRLENPLTGVEHQLKPAHEPICMARKPSKHGSLATHFAGGIAGLKH